MTDRELLELAAKATGVPGPVVGAYPGFYNCGDAGWHHHWNPLTDDGDALRLATRLCMSVSTGPCEASANTIPGALRGAFFKEETIHQCQDAAVRRVIVRAAAEVGEAMP